MVAGNKRSRSAKRSQRVIPGNKSVTRYRKKKAGVARCQLTGQKLNGVPRKTKAQLRNMPKSKKKPTRPFGGALSPVAMKRVMIERVRN
mgnify:CR=1 FL=1